MRNVAAAVLSVMAAAWAAGCADSAYAKTETSRAAAFMKVADAQRDRARAVWGNVRALKDIGEAMQTLAKFGQPKPL